MWSYYGSKANIIDSYPTPKFDKIIEPFAGSGRYALKYFEKDVLMVDKYDVIVKIWKWLQLCSENDILKLPRLKNRENLDNFNFDCEEAKLFMGFVIAFGMAKPTLMATKHNEDRPNFINYTLNKTANNLFKIRHWEIRSGSYDEIKNENATWFIDPPYQFGGHSYVCSSKEIDFKLLGLFCKERKCQAIVCETTKADWLPFKPMINNKSGRGKLKKEAIWSNLPTAFDNEQLDLFK